MANITATRHTELDAETAALEPGLAFKGGPLRLSASALLPLFGRLTDHGMLAGRLVLSARF